MSTLPPDEWQRQFEAALGMTETLHDSLSSVAVTLAHDAGGEQSPASKHGETAVIASPATEKVTRRDNRRNRKPR